MHAACLVLNAARAALALALACLAVPTLADPGGRHGPKHKDQYWDGQCMVERKFDKKGGYKEERKCRGPAVGYGQPAYGGPVYAPAPPAGVYVQPPAIVLQPPAVVIR